IRYLHHCHSLMALFPPSATSPPVLANPYTTRATTRRGCGRGAMGCTGGRSMSDEHDNTEVDRRRLLAAGAGAVGGLALAEAVAAADTPGKQVEDCGAGLKITRLRAMPAGPKAYVKIETNLKITGWGEVTGLEPHVACVLAESLFELLDGENPTRVE